MIIEIEDYVQEFLAWGTRLQESNTSSTKELIEAFADQFRSLEVVDSQMEHHGIWDAMRLSGGSSSPLLHSYPFDFRLSNRHWHHGGRREDGREHPNEARWCAVHVSRWTNHSHLPSRAPLRPL